MKFLALVCLLTLSTTLAFANGNTFYSLQKDTPGWTGYALLPPDYQICNSCKRWGPKVTWSWTPGIKSPSKDGATTQTTIGGNLPFSDVLWNNHLIGDFSSQHMPDPDHKIVPRLHNFTYDVWFYATNVEASQALEFDINQFFNGKSFIWGHECRVAGGHEWDTWNQQGHWVPSGIGCNPVNGWNHLVIKVQRTSDDHLLFQSISLNGQQHAVNRYDSPTSRPNWYGVTINYQLDGNVNQQSYKIYLDEVNFSYQ